MLVKAPFAWRGVTWGDAIEVGGVYVVLALYGSVAALAGTPRRAILGFAAISYALGHGIHVAANSASDMLAATGGHDPWGVVTLWDERIGHYLVDAGRVAFAIALTWMESSGASASTVAGATSSGSSRWLIGAGAAAYGFIYFATAVEGQTAPLALPFCATFAAWSAWSAGRRSHGSSAAGMTIRAFFSIAAWVALLFFAIWGVTQRGLPEFTKTGIL